MEEKKKGAFVMTETDNFRNWIKNGTKYPPAKNRYHLYVSYACPLYCLKL